MNATIIQPSPHFTWLAHAGHRAADGSPILRKVVHPRGQRPRELDKLAAQGWVEIPHGIRVDAFDKRPKDYVHVFDGPKGEVWLDVWSRIVQVDEVEGDGLRWDQRYRLETDLAGYRKFLELVGDRLG